MAKRRVGKDSLDALGKRPLRRGGLTRARRRGMRGRRAWPVSPIDETRNSAAGSAKFRQMTSMEGV